MSPGVASYPRPRHQPSRCRPPTGFELGDRPATNGSTPPSGPTQPRSEPASRARLPALPRAKEKTFMSSTASRRAEVLRGEVRDSLAHRDPVAQAAEPGIHGGPADPVDEGPLEVDRADVRRGEPDPLGKDLSFCIMNLPPAGVTVQDGGDPPRIRLNM